MKKLKFNVTGKRFLYLAVSAFFVVTALCFVFIRGFNLGIDFESGLSVTVVLQGEDVSIEEVRKTTGQRVQAIGTEKTYQIRCQMNESDDRNQVENALVSKLSQRFGVQNVKVVETNFIGAKFSGQLITGSIKAVGIALVLILLYVWMRFRAAYAICAIIALMHDVICMLGFISIGKFEITGTTIAAILTIIGYSLNNTIVIFDRVREAINLDNHRKLGDLIDEGVNSSLSRTTFSSITTLVAVIPLAVLASADVYVFSVCMIVGIVVGTYSSNFVATGLLYIIASGEAMDIRKPRKSEVPDFGEGDPKILV